jgi:hypothetical protein
MFVLQSHFFFIFEMFAEIYNTGKEGNTKSEKINYADFLLECTRIFIIFCRNE